MSRHDRDPGALAYRPEIDGLRALAVSAVFLFHAKTPYSQGGYLGVDAFFVISGYLIAAIIAKDLAAGRFSFLSFYRRRVMRILPAYIAVVLVVVAVSWVFLPPFLFSGMLDNAAASALFVSNFTEGDITEVEREQGLTPVERSALVGLDAVVLAVPHRPLVALARELVQAGADTLVDVHGALADDELPAGVTRWQL